MPQSIVSDVQFDLNALNQQFETAHPIEILRWSAQNIRNGLVQASAFNVDDLVITDILYRELHQNTPIIFLDTLFHFPETIEFVQNATAHYGLNLNVYKTRDANSREEFAARFGDELWSRDILKFHHVTKIEPLDRALAQLNTLAWITGRRRDQANTRADMPIFERDSKGRLKINPIAAWTRKETWSYVFEHAVMYNPLHDRGYPSIGDEPITTPVQAGEDERAGRWRGTGKTECGIHI